MESNPAHSSRNNGNRPAISGPGASREQDAKPDEKRELTPPRGYWWLQIWSGLVLATYIGTLLIAASGNNSGSFSQTSLLLVPILAFSSLITGARERYSIRTKPSRLFWGAVTAVFIAAFTLLALSLLDELNLGWLNIIPALAILALFTVRPITQLLRSSRRSRSAPSHSTTLSTPVRWNTVIMGAVGGLLISSADNAITSSLLMFVAVVGISVSFVITESRWTLPAAGFEWGSIQWTAFGITTCTLFALSLFGPLSAALSPELAAGLGIAVFLIMVTASALPTRTEATS